MAMAGCATYERCADKWGGHTQADTAFIVKERIVPVSVLLPADTIETIIDCNEINGQAGASTSSRGFLETQTSAEAGGRVKILTRLVPQYIWDTLRINDTLTIVREKITLAEKTSIWVTIAVLALIVLGGAVLVYVSNKP